MNYHFDIEEAVKYGVDEAIILNNFKYWLRKNLASKKNIHDGNVWTYNSADSFAELFPFWSEMQIRRILKSLISQGAIITGNYNKSAYDRTLWYAVSDPKVLELAILSNEQMEVDKQQNGFIQMNGPIPDNKTHIENTDTLFNEFWDKYPKKADKKKAMKAFNNLSNVKQQKAIKDCAIRFSDTEKKYIPLPTTYLHGERWDDELTTSVENDPYAEYGANQ